MMKAKLIFQAFLVGVYTLATACNKQSVIEGWNSGEDSSGRIHLIGRSVSLCGNSGMPIEIAELTIGSASYKLNITNVYYYGLSSFYFANTDSVRFVYLTINPTAAGTQAAISSAYNCVKKYQMYDTLPSYFANSGTTQTTMLLAAKKSSPYKGVYQGCDSPFVFNALYHDPQFIPGQSGYIAFQTTHMSGNMSRKYFGWILLALKGDSLSALSYRYASGTPPVCGK